MKKAFVLVILAVLLAVSGCAAGTDIATKKPIQTGGESDIALPSGMEQVEYVYVEDPESQTIFSKIGEGDPKKIDLSTADGETLKGASYVDYSKTFGEVENPREAADVAAIVVSEVYEIDPQEEAPFKVSFNETADAWIVQGSLPDGYVLGGVFLFVIGRESGDIILIRHGK